MDTWCLLPASLAPNYETPYVITKVAVPEEGHLRFIFWFPHACSQVRAYGHIKVHVYTYTYTQEMLYVV